VAISRQKEQAGESTVDESVVANRLFRIPTFSYSKRACYNAKFLIGESLISLFVSWLLCWVLCLFQFSVDFAVTTQKLSCKAQKFLGI
jgi:hypothetical protein